MKKTTLAGMLVGLTVWAGVAAADKVILKDGTVLEGDVVTENAAGVTINAEFANGSIKQTRTVPKAEIASVTRSTPEEKEAHAAQRAYAELGKYRLDPQSSFAVEQYDRVINDVFRKFLSQHPHSAHQADVEQKIADWQTERDQVVAGKAKFKGEWMPANEAANLVAYDQAEQTLQRARTLIAQQKFQQAITELNAMHTTGLSPQTVVTRQRMVQEAYGAWLAALESRLPLLNQEKNYLETRLADNVETLHRAQSNLDRTRRQSDPQQVSGRAMIRQAESAVQSAQNEMQRTEGLLNRNREEQTQIQQQLTTLRSQVPGVFSAAPVVATATETPAGGPVPEPVDVLTNTWRWVRENWMLAAGGGVIAIFLLNRLFR